MANQETSFQKSDIAGGQMARNRRLMWVIVALAVVILLAIAAFSLASDNGRALVTEEPPVAVPARLDGEAVGEPEVTDLENAGLYPRISATPWEYNHGQ